MLNEKISDLFRLDLVEFLKIETYRIIIDIRTHFIMSPSRFLIDKNTIEFTIFPEDDPLTIYLTFLIPIGLVGC